MDNSWYDDGLKALDWLERQSHKTDIFFLPFVISAGSRIGLQTVKLMIKHAGNLIERKRNGSVRYNVNGAMRRAIKNHIQSGLMEEVEPGTYRLTDAGEKYAQHLNITDPAAAEMFKRLDGSPSPTDGNE